MGVLKNLTEEYFGNKRRVEDIIQGVKYHHKFTDNNGTLHEDGYLVENGNYKTLQKLVDKLVKERKTDDYYGKLIDLNDIDVSNMKSLKSIFGYEVEYNEQTKQYETNKEPVKQFFDISGWDVSNVKDMSDLFCGCYAIKCDLSKWNVKNVETTESMFKFLWRIDFDITKWEFTEKLKNTSSMFEFISYFNQDISKWNISNVDDFRGMFSHCSEFDQDLSKWEIKDGAKTYEMFKNCPIKEEHKPKGI